MLFFKANSPNDSRTSSPSFNFKIFISAILSPSFFLKLPSFSCLFLQAFFASCLRNLSASYRMQLFFDFRKLFLVLLRQAKLCHIAVVVFCRQLLKPLLPDLVLWLFNMVFRRFPLHNQNSKSENLKTKALACSIGFL